MKKLTSFLILLMIVACTTQKKDTPTTNTEVEPIDSIKDTGHETFSYKEGDTTYVMQKYFLVLLKKGPNRDQPEEAYQKIQVAHQAYLEQLFLEGKLSISGPLEAEESDISGIVIFNTPTKEEVETLMQADPAVKAGRLVVEVLPWWAAKGSVLK
ncbi:YciI family protein [Leptobacterium sp. I13]|uniref:YciI family protein n=1 Tax=Leptobacterium meishanense TaxID=3128904 RepID=UPI0030ECBB42